MWEGPEALYNFTVQGASMIMNDPDTHEFRLLAAAEKEVEKHKEVMKDKIEKQVRQHGKKEKKNVAMAILNSSTSLRSLQRNTLNFSYGPLYVISDMCFNAPIDKYNYNVCALNDVTQDATKLGTFAGWLDDEQRRYKIDNGAVCHGVTSVDTKGNSVQVRRSGTVSISCGESHSILSVIENQPCVYEIQMQTFLVCDDKELER